MYFYDPTYILLIPAVIFTLIAQTKVNGAFRRYSQVGNRKNITGAEAARKMLDANGLHDVRIHAINGHLTDHYNPKNRTLNLSQSVYSESSVAAVSIACHEAGHALQHASGYTPLKLRNSIVPAVNFASRLAWPMMIFGLLLLGAGSYEMGYFGMRLLDIGIIGFGAVVVFHAVTLPVEFNASNRAIEKMEEMGLVAAEDIPGSRKVLRAAALTYVAALATAVANLLRVIVLRGRND